MIILLSPAKTLDYETPINDVSHSIPSFLPKSKDLRKLKEAQIRAQLKLDLAKNDDVNKRTQLEKQAELDIINLGNILPICIFSI